jgi:predicted amidohydrolase
VEFAVRVGDGADVAVLRSRSQRADQVDSSNCQLAREALRDLDVKRAAQVRQRIVITMNAELEGPIKSILPDIAGMELHGATTVVDICGAG